MAYEALFAETIHMHGHRGDRIDAYLARPAGPGPYGGVVVIHHMPGWDGPTKEIARRFAHEGYVAISPKPALPRREDDAGGEQREHPRGGRHAGRSHDGRRAGRHRLSPHPALPQR